MLSNSFLVLIYTEGICHVVLDVIHYLLSVLFVSGHHRWHCLLMQLDVVEAFMPLLHRMRSAY